jgi:predicted TIM-barrel fold metal-dependent hydrolase
MSHPDFDDVWTMMDRLGLAPTFHIGAFAERIIDDGWQSNDVIQYMTTQSLVMNGLDAQIALADLILNGVFDRHPDLTWIITEYSVGWLPELQFRLDIGFDIHYQVTAKHNVDLALRPSEYVTRNLRLVSFPTERPQKVMDVVGDILMFGSDFPHAEGQADPLKDYQAGVGDMDSRHDAFYGQTLLAALA